MSSIWTRNYWNLFCAVFGTFNESEGRGVPSHFPIYMRDYNGNYRKVYENGEGLNANSLRIGKISTGLGSVTTPVIALGTNNAEPSFDDFSIQTTSKTLSFQNFDKWCSYDETTHTYTRFIKMAFTNNHDEEVTFCEYGIFVPFHTNYRLQTGECALVYREVFDPITVAPKETIFIVFEQSITHPDFREYPTE